MNNTRFTLYEIDLLKEYFEMQKGYVLDFSDRTFKVFFNHYNIDIDNEQYKVIGTSKSKRLIGFINCGEVEKVLLILEALGKKADCYNSEEFVNIITKFKSQYML
jgi:hypothetical protein